MTRTYTFLATSGGRRRGYDFWPSRCVTSNARIRTVAIILFRKWFGGREPSFHWHKDGFMAEARDKRGNIITVEQTNHYHRYNPGATQMRRPLCPMVIKKEAA